MAFASALNLANASAVVLEHSKALSTAQRSAI
jgi:hypothetical protein